MTERTFFVRLNLDDMSAEVVGLDSTEERGFWLEGFLVGSRGKDPRENWAPAKVCGHAFGAACFREAEEFRGKQSAKGRASGDARRNRTMVQPRINHGSTTDEPNPNQTSTEPQPSQQPTSSIQQLSSQQPAATRQAGIPCSEFSPTDEHAGICAFRNASLEHQIARFRALNPTATDTPQGWEARFRHFLARARPEVEQSPISPPAPRQEPRRPSWAIDRDLNDARKELQRQQEARKEARDQRNRFSVGQAEYRKYSGQMADADERIREVEERIKALSAERGGII